MNEQHQHQHIVGFSGLIGVWIMLIILTAVTVAVSRIDLGPVNIWAALGIACTKATLVVAFFMHLKYERLMYKFFFLGTLMTLAIFIGMTFFDVFFRYR